MCKICIARGLVVDIFPWCNVNFVPFPSGALVVRQMRNGSIAKSYYAQFYIIFQDESEFGNENLNSIIFYSFPPVVMLW